MKRVAGRQRAVCALLFAGLILGLCGTVGSADARQHRGLGRHHARHHLVLPVGHAPVRHARAHHAAPQHYAANFAAMVVDSNSGRTLYAVNENELRHPASITKVMTLYLLFEQLEKGRLRLDSEIPISAHAASMPPTKLGLRAGSSITVENAIKAIVTQSANDMAVAVAEALGGSEENFAAMMTEKAHALGMTRTHYANASGLPDDQQLTTAHDLVLLGRAIQERFPRYYAYFSTHEFRFAGRTMYNHNHLLDHVAGMDGIKTGYTHASGFNLLTSVRRGGRHIIAVVLGGTSAVARDRIMAGLIEQHLAEAGEGGTALPVAESAPVDRPEAAGLAKPEAGATADKPRPAFVAGAPQSGDEDRSVTGSISPRTRNALDGSTNARAVGAVTPSSLHWVAGPSGQALKPLAASSANHPIGETKIAKIETGTADVAAVVDRSVLSHAGVMIQIGATDDVEKASALLARARNEDRSTLLAAQPFTEKVQKGDSTLYRARFAGLDADQAAAACKTLKRSGFDCFTTKN